MNKKALAIIALVIMAGAIILLLRSSQKQSQFQEKVNQAAVSQTTEASSDIKIDIAGFSFKQQIIKVKKGTKVTWTNQDSAKHTVTSDNDNYLDSAALNKAQTYTKTFDQTGTYRYHCDPHPDMLGAVIVID